MSAMRKRGFTLLEVMIAMAILAVSLTILLGSINSGVIYAGSAPDSIIATFLAQEKMTEIERKRDMLASDSGESGRFEDEFERFSWSYTAKLDDTAVQLAQNAGIDFSFEPLKVEVIVTWKRGNLEQSYVLQELIFPVVSTTSTGATSSSTTSPSTTSPFTTSPSTTTRTPLR